ncbi:MAG: D-alanine--D-alanine ligase [Lachnospiraceae bacterium]|nr:D-alanine--D-alanine ligase [Lachnospiraceae bacterium]
MKVVVLCGGLSTERKISLSSGTKICGALRERGHQAVLVDLFLGLENESEEVRRDPGILFERLPELTPVVFDGVAPDLKAVRASRKLKDASLFGEGVLEICKKADIVFVALHGMNGEDGRVQATFDMLGIPYTGSGHLGSAIAMDKMITKELLRSRDIPMPAWMPFRGVSIGEAEETAEKIRAAFGVPCVVKTPTGGSSVGVFIVREETALKPAVESCLAFGPDILAEQYIEGREFTCGVLKGRALPSVEIVPKTRFYDYSNKYAAGATEEICPGRTDPDTEKRMGDIALRVHEALGLRTYSRSDFMIDADNNVYFLEVNTLPGMTPTSLVPQEAEAVGISYGELCEMILTDGLARYTEKE